MTLLFQNDGKEKIKMVRAHAANTSKMMIEENLTMATNTEKNTGELSKSVV